MLTTDAKVISVDDHVLEHPRVWLDRLPAKYGDVAPAATHLEADNRRSTSATAAAEHRTTHTHDGDSGGKAPAHPRLRDRGHRRPRTGPAGGAHLRRIPDELSYPDLLDRARAGAGILRERGATELVYLGVSGNAFAQTLFAAAWAGGKLLRREVLAHLPIRRPPVLPAGQDQIIVRRFNTFSECSVAQ
jgi:hypothetical protein